MVLGFVATYFCILIPNEITFNASLIIFFSCFLFSFVLAITRLFRKEYLKGILQITATTIVGGISYAFLSFILLFYPYDFFANNLKIPATIRFEKPIDLDQNKGNKIEKTTKSNFILYSGMQPGIYKYELYLNKIEKGKVYLKIYEITKNQILSEEDIEYKSEIAVYNPTSELKKFKLEDEFIVYEGDWGQFYGSRIEVWFKPDLKNKPEKKLMTKNYIIQGWQR